jgi:hypothetical protein
MVRNKRRGKDEEEESYLRATKPHLWLKNKEKPTKNYNLRQMTDLARENGQFSARRPRNSGKQTTTHETCDEPKNKKRTQSYVESCGTAYRRNAAHGADRTASIRT